VFKCIVSRTRVRISDRDSRYPIQTLQVIYLCFIAHSFCYVMFCFVFLYISTFFVLFCFILFCLLCFVLFYLYFYCVVRVRACVCVNFLKLFYFINFSLQLHYYCFIFSYLILDFNLFCSVNLPFSLFPERLYGVSFTN
jgi:hypothetical protein